MKRNRPLIIGLYSSQMGAGKSTVAKHLAADRDTHVLSFAEPIKQMIYAMIIATGMDKDTAKRHVWGDLKEEVVPGLGVTSRRLQQTLGTEWGREVIDPDLWANIGLSKADRLTADGDMVFFDDMRFPNEALKIKDRGGFLVRVVRPGAVLTEPHASEGQLDGWEFDYTIWNEFDLHWLKFKANSVLEEIERYRDGLPVGIAF